MATGLTVDQLIRETHAILERCGVTMSHSRVSRLVRTYKQQVEHNGFPFAQWLANNIELAEAQRSELYAAIASRLSYRDPTGEGAARNVDRERGVRYVVAS